MKRYLLAALLLIACLAALFLCGCQDGEETPEVTIPPVAPEDIPKFITENDGESVTVLGYSGIESVITVPAEFDGLPVRVIAENAFRGVTRLTKVYLPDTVEIIDYAFVSCPDLTYVHLGANVTSLNGAFRGCTNLTTVEGGGREIYLDETYFGCFALTKGFIPATAKSALSTYEGCLSLSEVTVEEGITTLEKTFAGCTALPSIVIPSTVTETVDTFVGCAALTTVEGGLNVSIFKRTFVDCPLLTTIALGDNVTVLEGAFVSCFSLSTVTGLPTSLITYTPSFTGCRSLTELYIPAIQDVAALEEYELADDLAGCERLVSVTVLAEYRPKTDFCRLFSGFPSLTSVTLPDDTARPLLHVDYTYSDIVFEGTNKDLTAAIKKWKKAAQARTTPSYGTVGETPYTHIYGGDVAIFDPDDTAAETDTATFTPFTKSYYWCGYPDGGDRKEETVGIERIYAFSLRVTGKNDGSLPQSLTVNGMPCRVE